MCLGNSKEASLAAGSQRGGVDSATHEATRQGQSGGRCAERTLAFSE